MLFLIKNLLICDRASEKGPSGHIKFGQLLQFCCIITIIIICIQGIDMVFLPSLHNLISNILQFIEHKHIVAIEPKIVKFFDDM